ncbi:MAG TPA: hypothetical protein VE422_49935 [Terriglobia bacterium]|nr:hypothetical protein [Terriglobia bacterium]
MKRRQQFVVFLLVLLVVSQAPFLYRRYRFGLLQKSIDGLLAERVPPAPEDNYLDYRGVIHIHSRLGGHSTGEPSDIVTAARANDLAYVVMTEHSPRDSYAASAALRGVHAGIVFIDGSEVSVKDGIRLLVIPGVPGHPWPSLSAQEAIWKAKSQGKLAFIAYPEGRPLAEIDGYDGIEVYNAHTQTKRISRSRLFFDILWSYRPYAHLLATRLYLRPVDNLRAWDELNAGGRQLTAIGGIDAHANIGIALRTHASQTLAGVLVDPYALTFRIVRNYILLEKGRPFDAQSLLDAMAGGQTYVGFDLLADASGFRFTAENGTEKRIMGQKIALAGGVRFAAVSPQSARIVLLRNGQVEQEGVKAKRQEFTVHRQGAYRVEVYLDRLEEPLAAHPWIISNSIYVR